MSNSLKRTPISNYYGVRSEKWSKQKWHRRFRRQEKLNIMLGSEIEHYRYVSNTDNMPKEGKFYMASSHLTESQITAFMRK